MEWSIWKLKRYVDMNILIQVWNEDWIYVTNHLPNPIDELHPLDAVIRRMDKIDRATNRGGR